MRIRRRTLCVLAIAAVPVGVFGAQAMAGAGTPADKVVASGSNTAVIGANQSQKILTATMRTSKPADVMFQVALECTILTDLTTSNQNNSASAQAGAKIYVKVDGQIVPITSTSTPPQDPLAQSSGSDKDKVTFCDREYKRTVTDEETLPDGIDKQSDYIHTKSAHAFNWVRLNMGAGIHPIEVWADFSNNVVGDVVERLLALRGLTAAELVAL